MNFDWDNIAVDDTLTHDSRYFFAIRHSEHERVLPRIKNDMETWEAGISDDKNEIQKEHGVESSNIEAQKSELNVKIENVQKELENINLMGQNYEDNECLKTSVEVIKTEFQEEKGDFKESENKENEAASSGTPKSDRPKLVKEFKGAVPKKIPHLSNVPRVYEYSHKYKTRQQEALRQLQEEERKKRTFHSRPVPNFKQPIKQKVNVFTAPITPQVLKRSLQVEEKRLKRLEKLKTHQPIPLFKPRPADVVNEKPFMPKLEPLVVEQKPFNLRCESRLRERKKYDEAVQTALEEKHKQVEIEEERRQKLEEENIKQLRKATTFKARKNPFLKKE